MYKIICSKKEKDLSKKVSDAQLDGWVCQGGVNSVVMENSECWYTIWSQAMVKKDEEENKK